MADSLDVVGGGCVEIDVPDSRKPPADAEGGSRKASLQAEAFLDVTGRFDNGRWTKSKNDDLFWQPLNPMGLTQPPPTIPLMDKESVRLETFRDWNRSLEISPAALARQGFFVPPRKRPNQAADLLQCFACGTTLQDWDSLLDTPYLEHRRHSVKCPILENGPTKYIFNDMCGDAERHTALYKLHHWASYKL